MRSSGPESTDPGGVLFEVDSPTKAVEFYLDDSEATKRGAQLGHKILEHLRCDSSITRWEKFCSNLEYLSSWSSSASNHLFPVIVEDVFVATLRGSGFGTDEGRFDEMSLNDCSRLISASVDIRVRLQPLSSDNFKFAELTDTEIKARREHDPASYAPLRKEIPKPILFIGYEEGIRLLDAPLREFSRHCYVTDTAIFASKTFIWRSGNHEELTVRWPSTLPDKQLGNFSSFKAELTAAMLRYLGVAT